MKDLRTLEDLQPDQDNANKGTERGAYQIEESLNKYGAGRSIVVDKNGIVIAGNKTHEKAVDRQFGAKFVHTTGHDLVVVVRDDLDIIKDQEARELAIVDNRTGQVSLEWDTEILAEQLPLLDLGSFWTEEELSELNGGSSGGGQAKEDATPEPPATPSTQPGDLIILGRHRLVCGDAANEKHVHLLLEDDVAGLMATDPPYGVDFEGAKYNPRAKSWEGIVGDKQQGGNLTEWLESVLGLWLPHMASDASFYFWTAAMEEGAAAAVAIRKSGLHIQSQIIWNKNTLVLGQADYQWKHENCWYAFWKGAKHKWLGGRSQTTVWDISKIANQDYEHPMQKPIELYAIPIRNHLEMGEILVDPFAGSGSSIIAAEQEGRTCLAMEIDPGFCDVIVERWENYTGQEAERP